MRYLIPITVMALVVSGTMLLTGCGGAGSGPASPCGPQLDHPRSAAVLTESPTVEQVKAALEKLGKPLPDFLAGGAVPIPSTPPEGTIAPQAYMTVLTLNRWLYGETVEARRTQWYECNLTSWYALTDVYVRYRSGDPDLYVFSPLRPGNPEYSLELIGYSAGVRDEQVGSFITRDWGGPGRFVIAVYGYTRARYDLKIW